MERETTRERRESLFRSLRSTEHRPAGRLLLGSTARLNLPQFTADFPRFRMLPGNLTSSDQIPPARTNGKKGRGEGRSRALRYAPLAASFFTNAYVRKPRADLQASELSPVLFNACLKLIKAGRTSLVPADPQSELRVSTADNRIIYPRYLCLLACLLLPLLYQRDVALNRRRRTDEED